MSKEQFDKFINKPIKGAKKKEIIRQEKKAAKKEREAFFIEKKRQDRAAKKQRWEEMNQQSIPEGKVIETKPGKKFSPQKKESSSSEIIGKKKDRPNKNKGKKDQPLHPKTGKSKEFSNSHGEAAAGKKEKTAFKREFKTFADKKPKKVENDPGLPFKRKELKKAEEKPTTPAKKIKVDKKPAADSEAAIMPLNKYVSHGGVCSRRDAVDLVKSGKVKVNGVAVTNPAYKVQPEDNVLVNGKKIFSQKNLVYILLNKPKDYITTVEDPQGRKTVLDIVQKATPERVYPVGRLDRNTSGVLLLTNDGELAQHLTHPSFEVRKIYEAKLDRPLAKVDFEKLLTGIELEDGMAKADTLAYADSKDKSVIGIEIHSGRNRIVRRMFEKLGYDVKGLDRVMFANLTKKNVERGRYRFLTEKEVRLLKYFNKSKR